MGHKNTLLIENVIADTQYWIKSTVIHYNLCPFANAVFVSDRIGFDVSSATTNEKLLEDCLLAIQQLLRTPREELETTLLIHPQYLENFDDYLEFLSMVDVLLDEMQLLGSVQVASFHPDYCFSECDESDAANFTNRSPYPMLHLLREESVSEAVEEWTLRSLNVEDIPLRNIDTLRKISTEILTEQLKACYK